MSTMQLLFVEDDEGQLDLFQDAVKDWNKENPASNFKVTAYKAVDEAKAALRFSRFDGALFDLRLPPSVGKGKSSAAGGNELANLGLQECGIPVAVISGNTADLEETLSRNSLLKQFSKVNGAAYNDAIGWFGGLWDMMHVLAEVRLKIRTSGAEIFVRRIWPRWEDYKQLAIDELTPIITRQYAGHIAELLGLEKPDNAGWHPFENYINPALEDARAYTGDIFEIDSKLWVVLTPPCDMATQKVKNVLLAYCDRNAIDNWDARVIELGKLQPNESPAVKLARFFTDCVNQNVEASRHFLPPLGSGKPLLVNFREVITLELTVLNGMLGHRLASVAPPFLPNLTQRFGAYVSRTGQPNIDIRHFATGQATAPAGPPSKPGPPG